MVDRNSRISTGIPGVEPSRCPKTCRTATRVAVIISVIQFLEAVGLGSFLLVMTEPTHLTFISKDFKNDTLRNFYEFCSGFKQDGLEIILAVYIGAYVLFFLHTVCMFVGNEWHHAFPLTMWNCMVVLEISGSAVAVVFYVVIRGADAFDFVKGFSDNVPSFLVFFYLSRTFFIQWIVKLVLMFFVSKRQVIIKTYRKKANTAILNNDIELQGRTLTIPRPKVSNDQPKGNFDDVDGGIPPQKPIYNGDEVSYTAERRKTPSEDRTRERGNRVSRESSRLSRDYRNPVYDSRRRAREPPRDYDGASVTSEGSSVDRFTLSKPIGTKRVEQAVKRLSGKYCDDTDGVPGLRTGAPVPVGAKPAIGPPKRPNSRNDNRL